MVEVKNTYHSRVESLSLRKAHSEDVPYITNSWLKGYRSSAAVWGMNNTEFYHCYHKLLADILPRATTLVLSNKENPDQIIGWICFEKTSFNQLIIHYMNIKAAFRGMGFGRLMFEEVWDIEKPKGLIYTFRTKAAAEFVKANPDTAGRWRHNPVLPFILAAPGWATENKHED